MALRELRACHYAKDQFVDVILQMLIERVGYVFQMITLAGDIGIFQHHYFTPGEQGGKSNTTIKQRLTT